MVKVMHMILELVKGPTDKVLVMGLELVMVEQVETVVIVA